MAPSTHAKGLRFHSPLTIVSFCKVRRSGNGQAGQKGFFGNQNSVAKPKAKKWVHTVERLKSRFGIRD